MKFAIIFPRHSQGILSSQCGRTFGGATVVAFHLAEHLAAREDVTLVSLVTKYDHIDAGLRERLNITETYAETDPLLKKITAFHRKMRELKPDYLFQHGLTNLSCLMALYCYVTGVKFLFGLASDREAEGLFQRTNKKCLLFPLLTRFSYRIWAQNVKQKMLLEKTSRHGHTICVPKGLKLGRRTNILEKKYLGIWVARCDQGKRPEQFIEVARHFPNDRFCMVCSPMPDLADYHEKIRVMVQGQPNIDFFSFLRNDEVFSYMNISMVYFLTSTFEADWPLTVLEAMSCGLPIVSTKIDNENLLKGGECGYLAEDEQEIVRVVERLKEKHIYEKLSKQSYNYVKNNYNIADSVEKLLKEIA